MNLEAIQAVRDNPFFTPDCMTFNIKLENALIVSLRMFLKQNGTAFELIDPEWFADYFCMTEFERLKKIAIMNGLIFPEMKSLIWKFNRYWVCRKCKEAGAIYFDWRTITVEYARYLSLDQYNAIRDWEKKYESIKTTFTKLERINLIGRKTMNELFDGNYFSQTPDSDF